MDKVIKSLFTNGQNNGDVTIKCTDGTFTCHSFVICNVCPTLERMFAYAQKAGSSSIGADFSTKTMKYLISTLYDSSAGETFIKIHPWPPAGVSSEVNSRDTLDMTFILEYVTARDYFGVEHGIDDIPVRMTPSLLVYVISVLPDLSICEPMKKKLYTRVYDSIEELDLESHNVKRAFDNPSVSLAIAKMIKRYFEENRPTLTCVVCMQYFTWRKTKTNILKCIDCTKKYTEQ